MNDRADLGLMEVGEAARFDMDRDRLIDAIVKGRVPCIRLSKPGIVCRLVNAKLASNSPGEVIPAQLVTELFENDLEANLPELACEMLATKVITCQDQRPRFWEMMDSDELAHCLGCTAEMVNRWADRGVVYSRVINGRRWFCWGNICAVMNAQEENRKRGLP